MDSSDATLESSGETFSALTTNADDRAPSQIGPYRILATLGSGGMGVVYKAEQRSPVRRIVALKVIKLGMDSREVLARFEAERQALAIMNHPSVARVFDAGDTETGQPFFAMEFIPGEPITEYCDRQCLNIEQRLRLFRQACEAVQHAHTKGIIHRDLKPANVLVMVQDEKPLVKVIDFGVAKALTQRLTEHTLMTEQGQIIGTPEYMSPEQAEMNATDIDTRADVYSLGVVLYELLSGALPFDTKELRSRGYFEIQRTIREIDPPRPSTRLSSLGESASKVARHRGMEVRSLNRQLRRELEWIPLKAMRKDRTQRYRTASEIADDIDNYLEGKPLIAGPESAAYRFRTLVRRNRGPVAAAVVVLVVLIGGIVATSLMYWRAERQRVLAEARFNDVRDLANKLLQEVDPKMANLTGATAARRELVQAALDYLNKLQVQAIPDRALLREIGLAFNRIGDVQGNPTFPNLGDTKAAMDSYQRFLGIAQKLSETDPGNLALQRDLALAHQKVGEMLGMNDDMKGELENWRKYLTISQRLADAQPEDPGAQGDLVYALRKFGQGLQDNDNNDGALEAYQRSLETAQKLADANPKRLDALQGVTAAQSAIARMLHKRGETKSALETYRNSLAVTQKLLAADPTSAFAQRQLWSDTYWIGWCHFESGDREAAIEAFLKIVPLARNRADADPSNATALRDLWYSHCSLGYALESRGSDKSLSTQARRAALLRAREEFRTTLELGSV